MSELKQQYFASMNTSKGFQNYFSNVFNTNELKKVYILKGGPGTGKSSFMKHIAEHEIAHGNQVEFFLCSSDPSSYDGIIIQEKKIAILDGTAPHNYDPHFPGVVEEIINLGEFWDAERLLHKKSEIIDLITKKNNLYQRSYHFLSAYGKICDEILSYIKKQILSKKMAKNIKVQASLVFSKNEKSKETIRNIETICKDGVLKLNTFEKICEKIWIVEDYYFSAYLYMNALYELAKIGKQEFIISYSPLFPNLPNAIYFPEEKACFVVGKRDYDGEINHKEYHYINMKRFLKMETIKEAKSKLKFTEKCSLELLNGAIESFKEAGLKHKETEAYYIAAMNFEKLEKEIQKFEKS